MHTLKKKCKVDKISNMIHHRLCMILFFFNASFCLIFPLGICTETVEITSRQECGHRWSTRPSLTIRVAHTVVSDPAAWPTPQR